MAIKETLLAEYDHEMGATRRLLERIPEEKFGWKPHERSMSLGDLATHLSSIPRWAGAILNDQSFDLASAQTPEPAIASRAAILDLFDQAVRQTRVWLDRSDPEYAVRWSLKRDGHEMFSLPRVVAFRTFVVNHIIHHRGQLSVYLRLTGIPVPSIYGPSADEG